MTNNKLRELRNQLVSDINRPDGRWGIHGHRAVDDDYFLALVYVVGRMDEVLSHQPTDDVEMTDEEIDDAALRCGLIDQRGYSTYMEGTDLRPDIRQIVRLAIERHEAKKGATK